LKSPHAVSGIDLHVDPTKDSKGAAAMMLGMEIALAVMGLLALVTGKMRLSKNRVVVGPLARFLGFIALMPAPLAVFAIAAFCASTGQNPNAPSLKWTLIAIEAGAIGVCALAMYGLGALVGRPRQLPQRYPVQEQDPFASCMPNRSGERLLPADSIQGSVPLQTMAPVRCQKPRQTDEIARPEEPKRMGLVWLTVLVFLGIMVVNTWFGVTKDGNSPAASNAPVAAQAGQANRDADAAAQTPVIRASKKDTKGG
jgi:Na+-transporting methylmalonyl-CoA/oxaloacetate decarboxylase gamma subunit